jgi:L-ascorbate metabolism protein UlaG (beta-lactamase superfamily)
MLQGASVPKLIWAFLHRPQNCAPPKTLPSVRTDLRQVSRSPRALIWFGHSSYLLCIAGKNILVDPVFSGHASPFSSTNRSFAGADVYGVDDLPPIDLLLLTHDHYDHLDFETMRRLRDRVACVCTSLGVGSHLTYWGMDPGRIREMDWGEEFVLAQDLRVIAVPARHFSGRTMVRNRTLWSAFIIAASGERLYLGGDSGYGDHFREIGEKWGPFDLAVLESGQYNASWPFIHMMPDETVRASADLRARLLMPVHWGKFCLSLHPWDEPPRLVREFASAAGVPVTSPRIGEPVDWKGDFPELPWWENL